MIYDVNVESYDSMSVVLSTYNSGGHCPGESRGIYFKYQVIDDSHDSVGGIPSSYVIKIGRKKIGVMLHHHLKILVANLGIPLASLKISLWNLFYIWLGFVETENLIDKYAFKIAKTSFISRTEKP